MVTLRGEHRLSPREKETLRLMMAGYDNQQIGKMMDIRPGTLSTYITAIARALGVGDGPGGAKLVRVALQRLLHERVGELEAHVKRLEEENMSLRSKLG